MREIPLHGPHAVGEFAHALVDDEDEPEISRHSWRCMLDKGRIAGDRHYVFRYIWTGPAGKRRQQVIYLHRQLMGLTWGDGKLVDHKDGNGLNNQRENLRLADSTQNQANKRGFSQRGLPKGVAYQPRCKTRKYIAQLRYRDQHISCGCWPTAEDAKAMHDLMARCMFGPEWVRN
jgi:hypothetical protein